MLALDLAKRTELSTEDISDVLNTVSYRLRPASENELKELSQQQIERLQAGATIFGNRSFTQLFVLRDEVMIVEPFDGNSRLRTTLTRMALSS